jgi:hypothetical protein
VRPDGAGEALGAEAVIALASERALHGHGLEAAAQR